ncbi:hypothetical protein [Enterobacter ludwigii]|uniref:hypothetical protein n=1 Tax=Enterobacter ludwigii TaxID=299767 RepID=UPI003F6EEFD4
MSNTAQSVNMLVQGMVEDRETYGNLTSLLAEQRQWFIARDAAKLDQLLTKLGTPGLRTLEQLAAECKALNDSNITVLSMQQEILQNLLNIGEPENWLYEQV